MTRFYVTGSDTEVGKTIACACLATAWDADYWKPVQTGLAEMKSGAGTLIAFATGPGQTALDGQGGTNGPFTRALMANITQPGVEIQQAMTQLHPRVAVLSFGADNLRRMEMSRVWGVEKPYFTLDEGQLVLRNVPVQPRPDPWSTLNVWQRTFGWSYLLQFSVEHFGSQNADFTPNFVDLVVHAL